ncbi:sensor histidine kinase response regulator [Stemphylium lycopersici]|nr:sensor histidine kinase response regulator [Stemphylium lycopersici]
MSQSSNSHGAIKTGRYDMRRERDVLLLYGAAFRNIPHVDNLDSHIARPSLDSTLTALCQLTAIRLGGQRSMISLLDEERQHILAEATCDISLRPEVSAEAPDCLWLGNVSIPRSWGLCEKVLDLNTNEEKVLVINDLAKDGRSCFRDDVQKNPDMRFYAGVALLSPDGAIVGTLCIFDNKPREGLSEEQLILLKDLAFTVTEYLNTYTIRDEYSRGERFTRGLVSFAEGASGLLPLEQGKRSDPSTPPQTSSDFSSATEKDAASAEDKRDETGSSAPVTTPPPSARPRETRAKSARHRAIRTLQDSILPVDSKSMFSRAANVMMASSNLDGVLILDASVAANGGQRRANISTGSGTGTDAPSESYQSRSSSEEGSSNSAESNTRGTSSSSSKMCQLLGVATPNDKDNAEYGTLLEPDLARMLHEYPKGKVFTFTADGTSLSSDEVSSSPHITEQLHRPMPSKRQSRNHPMRGSEAIQTMFPFARSVAFIPFWDFERSRWFAGCLCWSNDPYRLLSPSVDLTYFKIFSNSIMRELSRLDALTLNEASMFNSLHGCGITLLDTINHVMDYAKISEPKKGVSSKRIKSENTVRLSCKPVKSGRKKGPAFDIGVATEEVVEAVFSGSSYTPVSSKLIETPSSHSDDESTPPTTRRARFIVFELAHEEDWVFSFPIGSWRRIVMNLFGNAVKYTESGLTLTVTDTGSGMDSSFLANRIFEPFSQQNPHAPGIGLGLSIVRQIIDMSGGKIEVSSQPSVGSRITVKLSLTRPASSELLTPKREQFHSFLPRLQGRKICILRKKIAGPSDNADVSKSDEGLLRFTNALVDTLEKHLKMAVVKSTEWEGHDADIVICPELSFDYLNAIRRRRTQNQKAPVTIFIGMDALEAATLRSDVRVTNKESVVEVMTQPCGPYKLAFVLNQCLDRYDHPDENLQPRRVFRSLPQSALHAAQHPSNPTSPIGSMQGIKESLIMRSRERAAKSAVTSHAPQSVSTTQEKGDPVVPHTLIVDDNNLNRRLLVAFLKKNNLRFQEASNGLEALQKYQARTHDYEAILMDMSMPVMDGMSATRAIRDYERDNNLPRSCIIALTGLASSSAKLEAWSSGIDHFMTKPVNYKELGELLKSGEARKLQGRKNAATSRAGVDGNTENRPQP